MGIITKMRKDVCVYWALQLNDSGGQAYDGYGQPQYQAPVELSCRWEDVAKEFVGPTGTKETSQSIVYVKSDVDVAGMLFHGSLVDLDDVNANPRTVAGAWEIRRFDKLPTLKYIEHLRTVYL